MKENQLAQRVALIMKEATMSKTRLALSLMIASASLFLTAQVAVRAFPLKARPIQASAPAVRVEPLVSDEQNEEIAASDEEPAKQKVSPANTSQDLSKPQPIHKVNPIYPPLAKMAKIEGIVKLEITVEKNGDVSDIKAMSGHPLLVKAAVDAVSQWKYAPQPHVVESTVTVNFTLEKENSDEEKLAEVKAQLVRVHSRGQSQMSDEEVAEKLTEAKTQLARVQAGQQIHMTNDQIRAAAILKAEKENLVAKLKEYGTINQLQGQKLQLALMMAQKADLEARIDEAEIMLKAAQNNFESNPDPKPVKSVPPVYPPEAKAAHIQGEVVLQLTLDEDGGVSKVEVENGPPALAKAAVEAVRQWRFSKPPQAPFTTIMTFKFGLADPESKTPASTPPSK